MKLFIVSAAMIVLVTASAFSIAPAGEETQHSYLGTDSLEAERLKYMNAVLESIKGMEQLPADSVFKNLKVIKGASSISAEHLLWMMNWGWSAELGVSCNHCHVIGKWESDSIQKKDIARGMWLMRVKINNEILPGITGRNYDQQPAVTCITCHRGKAVPDAG
ncbi:MAG TPA: c-type cytochrome [Panacibacter sp.]|nr:c-type cytochrome [Panacibacter sp.]HNP44366.1 c-type cytochrome [Panacibacter sp.]